MKENHKLLLLLLFVFASRIPFLFAGYGAEEDSWGVALNALLMERTGIYEYSRIPGHPVQEYIYAFLPVKDAWLMNGCTALMSTLCVLFFYHICKKINVTPFTGACMLAFTPVFFVNSSNNLDYNWALCFMLAAFYFMLNKKNTTAAICLGIAVGCRITSGAFLLPLVYYLYATGSNRRTILRFVFISLAVCALVFTPVIARYGKYFFGYVNQFGVPPFLKTLFKGTIGVWGIAGAVCMCVLFVLAFFNWRRNSLTVEKNRKGVIGVSLLTVALFATSYLYEPHKGAYLIPLIPFVILFVLINIKNQKGLHVATCVLFINCFFMGINLADDNRSAVPSKLAHVVKINNQKISIDVLKGNVVDDYGKRIARMQFADNIVQKTSGIKKNTLVISGYWLNTVLMQQYGYENPFVTYVHYVDEKTLLDFKNKQYDIFVIHGQETLNDRCYNGNFTMRYAALLD